MAPGRDVQLSALPDLTAETKGCLSLAGLLSTVGTGKARGGLEKGAAVRA